MPQLEVVVQGIRALCLVSGHVFLVKELPSSVTGRNRTPEFTEQSVPDGLLRSHRTKQGTWGVIVVLEGSLTYRILMPDVEEVRLDPEFPGVIEPTVEHELELHSGVRFYIQFYS